MEIFINEYSPHYHDLEQFTSSILEMNRIFELFLEVEQKDIYSDNYQLFHSQLILKNTIFIANIDKINPEDSKAFFRLIFNQTENWTLEDNRQHSPDDHFYCTEMEEEVTNSSIAELAERKLMDRDLLGVLLNFPFSNLFQNTTTLSVIKNETEADTCELSCLATYQQTQQWLEDHKQTKSVYDPTCGRSPTDEEMGLTDISRFEITTHHPQNGRRIFRELTTEYLWYVDSSPRHANEGAHCEVFNKRGTEHLGTANYRTLELDTNYAETDRRLNL